MKGLDTNVLVRYLTQDDPAQARKANGNCLPPIGWSFGPQVALECG